ncbi:MAG: TonB-dependent receptor plug domain-containing protein, partial [Opitutaceae bacterium]|nr:TonB-dependent receptor plug domain-containing protein [Opitutaceae bacterium]
MSPLTSPGRRLLLPCKALLLLSCAASLPAQQTRPAAGPASRTGAPAAIAQSGSIPVAAPPAAGGTDDTDGEITHLTPFVVTSSARDTGYYVENTLAGTRLNTNIADLASSITVVTRRQMEDTAANDLNDIFLYEANTEGTGNYTSISMVNGVVIDNTASRPETANRVRGLGSVDRSRNFYPSLSLLPFDAYNTESVEINRGPNSLLFGLGSPAGIVNQSTAIASTTRAYAQVKTQLGSYDDFRAQFRANLPLVRNRLGLFVGGLYGERGFARQPAYEYQRRGYVAVSANVSPATSIRANYESYHNTNRRPNSVTPQDYISDWRAAGSPGYDPGHPALDGGVAAVAATVWRDDNGDGARELVPGGTWQNTDGLHSYSLSGFPTLYFDRGEPLLWMQSRYSSNGLAGRNDGLILAAAGSAIAKNATRYPLFIQQGVTDRSLYDWEKINIASVNTGRTKADIYNLEIDQKILDNLYIQLGWYREDFDLRTSNYMGGGSGSGALMVDVNMKLLDGTDNPQFGRPYVNFTGPADTYSPVQNDNLRASLAYTLDFRKERGWKKWLGQHRLMGLWSRQDLDSWNLTYVPIVSSSHSWTNDQNKMTAVGAQYTNVQRWYVGDPFGGVAYAPGAPVSTSATRTYPLLYAEPGAGGAYAWIGEDVTLSPQIH